MSTKNVRQSRTYMETLTLSTAKQNIATTIQAYKSLKIPFEPLQNESDAAITKLLPLAKTWPQMSVLSMAMSPRFGFLQNPILPLPSNEIEGVQNTVGFQFNEGSTGWYWMYGLSNDGATGFLLLITRFQTKGQGTAADSFYGLSGYVVQNHVAMPYSTYHTPIACPASYTATSDGVSMIFDLTDTRDDPNVMLAAVTFAITDGSKTIRVALRFKSNESFSSVVTSTYNGVYRGVGACVPACVAGAGTKYWSFTYQTGQFTNDNTKTSTSIVGWFDHQWVGVSIRNPFYRFVSSAASLSQPPKGDGWMWFTLQPSAELQYSLLIPHVTQRERVQATAVHATHTAEETQYNNGVAVLGRFARVEILNVACGFPSLVGVTVQNGTRYLLKAVTDGRITVYNAALTLESLALLYVETKDETTPTLVGVGAIEAIGVTNMKTDEVRKAELFAPYDASGLQALSTLSAKETPDTVAAIVVAALVLVLIIVGCILAIVFATRSNRH